MVMGCPYSGLGHEYRSTCIHCGAPEPIRPPSVPPWCPSFDALESAKGWLRSAAAWVHHTPKSLARSIALTRLQWVMDDIGGGPVLRDDLELDDDSHERQERYISEMEANEERTER